MNACSSRKEVVDKAAVVKFKAEINYDSDFEDSTYDNDTGCYTSNHLFILVDKCSYR